MNQAAASVRGTIFHAEDTGERSTVWVHEGEVEFTARATGETISLAAGEMASADRFGMHRSAFDPEAERFGIDSAAHGLTGAVDPAMPAIRLPMTVTRAGALAVEVSVSKGARLHARLFDVNGWRELAQGNVRAESSAFLTRDGLAPGTYVLELRAQSGTAEGSWSVRPHRTANPTPPDSEPIDTWQEAQPVSPGMQATGQLGFGNVEGIDRDDWFKVTISEAGTLTVDLEAEENLKVHLRLYDVSGTRELDQDAAGYASSRSVARSDLPSGTYYVWVRLTQANGGYTIRPSLTSAPAP